MSLLNQTYEPQGDDNVSTGGRPEARVIDATIADIREAKTKASGEAYLQLDLDYKDENGTTRSIKYQNFSPNKSESGKQLFMNLLVVAGVKTPADLKGKAVKVVVRPEEYPKADGSTGVTVKPVVNGYFSSEGISASGSDTKILELLQETLDLGVKELPKRQAPQSSPETSEDLPF